MKKRKARDRNLRKNSEQPERPPRQDDTPETTEVKIGPAMDGPIDQSKRRHSQLPGGEQGIDSRDWVMKDPPRQL